MKRSICFVMSVAAAASLLCGCGMYRTDGGVVVETPYVSPVIDPSMSPIITPDMEDGIVDDRDGIIDDDAQNRETANGNSAVGSTAGNTDKRSTSRNLDVSPRP